MAAPRNTPGRKGFLGKILREIPGVVHSIVCRLTGSVDLRGKVILFDNDELLLAWENELREQRVSKEKDAWRKFEREFGEGSPEVSEAFSKWQDQLYAYIEKGKDRFLKARQGSKAALDALVYAGAKTIVVTKGAKPYTQKCFNLVGLSASITHIYSPAPGNRRKRFADAVHEQGKNTSRKCLRDVIVVGHDAEKDMAWDLVPAKTDHNDGNAPVLILFDAMVFDRAVDAAMDALPEIITLLAKKGDNDFLKGFKAIDTPEKAVTKNYSFKKALYHTPKKGDKTGVPVVYAIKKRPLPSGRKK